jgi:hypothetical protein
MSAFLRHPYVRRTFELIAGALLGSFLGAVIGLAAHFGRHHQ